MTAKTMKVVFFPRKKMAGVSHDFLYLRRAESTNPSSYKSPGMIEVMKGLPPNVAAFKADGKISRDDYDNVIYPIVDKIYKDFGKINYLLLIDTDLGNYSAGAWMKDALLGFIYFTEWRKIAIVSDRAAIRRFTNVFGIFVPGKCKGFKTRDLGVAKEWVSE